jgi:tetratricopeptide (TPR) repeat protein
MRPSVTRIAGLVSATAYAAFIVWLYSHQPASVAQVTGGVAASLGVYRIDQARFDDGLKLFRADQFAAARAAFARADPATRDAVTQFYVAYSFVREGWGRLYHDDKLYKSALEAVDRAIALAPDGRLVVDDADLRIKTADELRALIEAGLVRDAKDLNPLRVFERRP